MPHPVPDSWLAINLSVPYRQVRRRRAFEWNERFPAGALAIGGFGRSRWRLRRTRRSLSFSMGFQWPFRYLIAPGVPKGRSLRAGVQHNEVYYPSKRKNLVAQKTAVPRARDSVRRASDFVQIAIALTDPDSANSR